MNLGTKNKISSTVICYREQLYVFTDQPDRFADVGIVDLDDEVHVRELDYVPTGEVWEGDNRATTSTDRAVVSREVACREILHSENDILMKFGPQVSDPTASN